MLIYKWKFKENDVWIDKVDNEYVCVYCCLEAGGSNFNCSTLFGMIKHLKRHKKKGHLISKNCIRALKEDAYGKESKFCNDEFIPDRDTKQEFYNLYFRDIIDRKLTYENPEPLDMEAIEQEFERIWEERQRKDKKSK